jgi:peptidoglycan hydrolase-like protein with peptidoglycan-binding domain
MDPAMDIDGFFDNETLIAVVKYQYFNGLKGTGDIDYETQQTMSKSISEQVPFGK